MHTIIIIPYITHNRPFFVFDPPHVQSSSHRPGLISETCKHLHSTKIHTLLRPCPGDFLYTDNDLDIIKADLLQAVSVGVHGIVFGCLTPQGHIAIDQLTYILDLCTSLGVDFTFHRAFDVVKDQSKSLQDLIGCGVKRVLSSGGHPTSLQGADELAKLVSEGGDRIAVMAGGGITDENAVAIVETTGVKEIHGTFKREIDSEMSYIHPRVEFSGQRKRYAADGDMIERIRKQLEENME